MNGRERVCVEGGACESIGKRVRAIIINEKKSESLISLCSRRLYRHQQTNNIIITKIQNLIISIFLFLGIVFWRQKLKFWAFIVNHSPYIFFILSPCHHLLLYTINYIFQFFFLFFFSKNYLTLIENLKDILFTESRIISWLII